MKREYNNVTGVFVPLRSVIMVDLLGLDKLPKTFGIVNMAQGMSAFIGAPIAGKSHILL